MVEYYCPECGLYTTISANPTGEIMRCSSDGHVLVRMEQMDEKTTREMAFVERILSTEEEAEYEARANKLADEILKRR